MAGYQRPERREGDPEPLDIAADVDAPTTVLGSTNSFTMSLDYAARSVGTLDEVVNRLQSINFYWELIQVTGQTEEQAEQTSRETAVGENEDDTVGIGSGESANLSRTAHDIADDQEADIRMMSEQNWSWQARAAYLGVIGLSNSVRMIGSLISSYVRDRHDAHERTFDRLRPTGRVHHPVCRYTQQHRRSDGRSGQPCDPCVQRCRASDPGPEHE